MTFSLPIEPNLTGPMLTNCNSYVFHLPSVQLANFDLGGVLHHANYLLLFEQARESFLLENHLPYAGLVKNNLHLVLADAHLKFIKPVIYGDPISIKVNTTKIKETSLLFTYQLFQNETLCNQATTKHALVNIEDGFQIVRLPTNLKQLFLSIEKQWVASSQNLTAR